MSPPPARPREGRGTNDAHADERGTRVRSRWNAGKSDVFLESALQLVGCEPLGVFKLLGWAFLGKAELKRRVAARIPVDAATLRYEQRLLEMGQQARAVGREVVLATAAAESHAAAIAAHTGFFDRILASGNGENLSAHRKARALRLLYGEKGFDYAGNSRADAPVWRAARHAIIVNPLLGATSAAHANARVIEQIDESAAGSSPPTRWCISGRRICSYSCRCSPRISSPISSDWTPVGGVCGAFSCRFGGVHHQRSLICRSIECPDKATSTAGVRCLADSICVSGDAGLLIAGFA